MSNETRLSKGRGLGLIKQNLDNLKKQSRHIESEINDIIASETIHEKNAYEKALKKYNDRMNEVLKRDDVQNKIKNKYACEEKMYSIFDKVKDNYNNAVKMIMKQPISKEEKEEKIIKLQQKIQEALVNDEDRKIMTIINEQMKNLPYNNIRLLC